MKTERLLKLSMLPGVSGNEKNVSEFLKQELSALGFESKQDPFGNLHAHRPGRGKHILFEAHMDQVGLMVSDIDEKGFLSISPVGSLDLRILPLQEVIVWGKEPIKGVINIHPPEDKEEKGLSLKQLSVDTGLGTDVKDLVSVGDFISFDREAFIQNGFIVGPALDNRASVETILSCLETTDSSAEISVLFAVQEELGMVGATVGSNTCNADFAVVLDVTFGRTHFSDETATFICGCGPAIGMGPNVSRVDAKTLLKVAKREGIPFQLEVMGGSSGTDAWAIQLSGKGIRTVLLSLPLRYMHTPNEQVTLSDIESTVSLMNAYLKEVCADA